MLRRIAGRLGLDFIVSGVKFANRQIGECTREYAINDFFYVRAITNLYDLFYRKTNLWTVF